MGIFNCQKCRIIQTGAYLKKPWWSRTSTRMLYIRRPFCNWKSMRSWRLMARLSWLTLLSFGGYRMQTNVCCRTLQKMRLIATRTSWWSAHAYWILKTVSRSNCDVGGVLLLTLMMKSMISMMTSLRSAAHKLMEWFPRDTLVSFRPESFINMLAWHYIRSIWWLMCRKALIVSSLLCWWRLHSPLGNGERMLKWLVREALFL